MVRNRPLTQTAQISGVAGGVAGSASFGSAFALGLASVVGLCLWPLLRDVEVGGVIAATACLAKGLNLLSPSLLFARLIDDNTKPLHQELI